MQDYSEQMEFWAEVPPVNVSLMLIAKAHGAKFAPSSARPETPVNSDAELGMLLGMGVQRTN